MQASIARTALISILRRLRTQMPPRLKSFPAFVYLKRVLDSERTMFGYCDCVLNDLHNVEDVIKGKVLIDAGCGAGVFSVMLSLMGATTVYAVDYLEDCVELASWVAEIAEAKNISVIRADIGGLRLPEGSIDGVFSIEALSHYRNPGAFIEVAGRRVRRGGFLVIRDGNNGASWATRERTQRIWYGYENVREPCTIGGHTKSQGCYLDARKKIIREAFASLPDTDVESYGEKSFGYSRDEVIEVVKQFLRGRWDAQSQYASGKCPLDPETDTYMEKVFNPLEVREELMRHGFRSKVYSVGPARSSLRILRWLWEAISPVTIYSPRAFRIVALRQ